MGRKRHSAEEIANKLRQAEVEPSKARRSLASPLRVENISSAEPDPSAERLERLDQAPEQSRRHTVWTIRWTRFG